jgi:hypothetical protein
MPKRKSTKGHTTEWQKEKTKRKHNDLQKHRNIMIEQREHPKEFIQGRTQVLWKVSISCSTSVIRCVTIK